MSDEKIRVWSIGEDSELFAAHSEEEVRSYYTDMVGNADAEQAFDDHFEELPDLDLAHEYDNDGKKEILTLRELIEMNAPPPCQISTSYH